MKLNKLIPLFIITVIVVVFAVISTRRQTPVTRIEKTPLFPDFKAVINDVKKISVKQGNESLTVIDEDGQWKISEADGYPALFSKVKQTAVAISDMKVIARKTKNPDLYQQLGVEDPAGANAKSRLLTLSDGTGKTLVSLIVGKNRLSRAASESHGLYVRLPNQKQALLVEANLEASVKVADWIDRNLTNIEPARISKIFIDHGDKQNVTLERVAGKKDLVLENVPQGKQARTDYTLTRMEGILEDLRIDNVRAEEKIKFPDSAVTATVNTIDGLTAVITSAAIGDKDYARFSFQYDAPAKTESKGTAGKDADQDKTKDKGSSNKKTKDIAKEVADLSAKTTGWVYQIPAYKYDTFTRKLDDLVEDIPKKTTDKKSDK